MDIIWQVYCISCLLFVASAQVYVAGNSPSNSTLKPEAADSVSSTAHSPTVRSVSSDDEAKSGDLDLETQDQVAILKQINRVNDDGSYTFGYEAADGSFKIETRDVNGNVKGMFGFVNEDGELKRVSYSASNGTGFRSTGGRSQVPEETTPKAYVIKPVTEDTSTTINLLDSSTNGPDLQSPRLPVYIFGTSTPRDVTTARPVVIQHIPKVRPTPGSSKTTPTESEEILLKPLLTDLTPKRTSNNNYISFGGSDVTTEKPETTTTTTTGEEDESGVIQVIRPRLGPYKKVVVTKRPTTTPKVVTTTEFKAKGYLERFKGKAKGSEGNGIRRQLGIANAYVTPSTTTTTTTTLAASGTEDSPDVYGGGHTARPYPTNAYRALFSQVPQHQRILQTSYLKNQNQYLAAALGNPSVVPTTPATTVSAPTTVRTYTGQPSTFVPTPVPDIQPVVPAYPQEQPAPQIIISPGLIEQIIRMVLIAQQRQMADLYNTRYYQQQVPYPNYSQVPYSPMIPAQYPLPYYHHQYVPVDPRYVYHPQMFTPVPYPRYQPRPYPGYPEQQQQPQLPSEDYGLRAVLGYPRGYPQPPVPPVRTSSNVVERSSEYLSRPDSSPSSTTPAPRVGPVRNVEILGQIGEESQTVSSYESSTKPAE